MYNLVRAIKITKDGRTKNLSGLVRGDNLERDGKREIVESSENYNGLYSLTTMRVTIQRNRMIRNRYLASEQMLNEGELRAEIPNNEFASYFDEQFYEEYLIRHKPAEATA